MVHASRGYKKVYDSHTGTFYGDWGRLSSGLKLAWERQGKKTDSTFFVCNCVVGLRWHIPWARAWVVWTYCQQQGRRQPGFLLACPDVGLKGHESDGAWKLSAVRHQRWNQTLHYKDPTQIPLTSFLLSHNFSSEFPAFGIWCLNLLFNFPDIWLMEMNLVTLELYHQGVNPTFIGTEAYTVCSVALFMKKSAK